MLTGFGDYSKIPTQPEHNGIFSQSHATVITYTFLPTVAACKSLLNPRVVSGTAQKRKYSFPSHRKFTLAVDRNFLTFLLVTNP